MIRTEGLDFRYEKEYVLHDFSVEVARGEFCTLLGQNGSGKTTLLKLLLNFAKPERGNIFIDGKNLREYGVHDLAKKIAYVPQNQEVIFDLSVYDLVMMGRNPYQNRWQKSSFEDIKIVEDALRQADLWAFRDRFVSSLSGGERQRALIARAVAQQTPILLLDEPLANLDIAHKYEIMALLRHLNRMQRTTILLVLHDFSMAAQFSSKVILLKAGALRGAGAPGEVLTSALLKEVFDLSDEVLAMVRGLFQC